MNTSGEDCHISFFCESKEWAQFWRNTIQGLHDSNRKFTYSEHDNSLQKSTIGSRNKVITLSSEESKLDISRSSAHEQQTNLGLSFNVHEGYLYKHVHKMKIFQLGSFNLRYFKIDTHLSRLQIFNSDSDVKTSHEIKFKDIFKVAGEKSSEIIDKGCPWKNVFVLFTMDRPFRLYARTAEEKDKWTQCLNEIIEKQGQIQMKQVVQAKKEQMNKINQQRQ